MSGGVQLSALVPPTGSRLAESYLGLLGRDVEPVERAGGDLAEHRRRDQTAHMAMADVFEHHQHDQARVVGGNESDKGTNQPVLVVRAGGGIDHLRGAGLACHHEIIDSRAAARCRPRR